MLINFVIYAVLFGLVSVLSCQKAILEKNIQKTICDIGRKLKTETEKQEKGNQRWFPFFMLRR